MRTIIAILLSWLSIASIPYTTQAQDAKANSILDNMHSKYYNMKSLKMNIKLEASSKAGKSSKNGTISIKGDKYNITMPEDIIINDGTNNYVYNKKYNEVQISKADDNSKDFLSIFVSMDKQFLKKYTASYIGEKTMNGSKHQAVELKPKSASTFNKINLYISSAGLLSVAEFYAKNGDIYKITGSNITMNPSLSSDLFKFDQKRYPKISVIDLR